MVDGSVEVLGTPLRTRNFQLQLRGFDPDKATTNFAGGDTCELKTPSKPRHSIDVAFSTNYQKQFKRSEPTAALGFNKADEDDRYGPEEPATWWVTFHVPYEILETLIVAIKASRCREFIVGGQFVNLYCTKFQTRGDFISWGLLPSRVNSSAPDAPEHWIGDPDGGYPQAHGTFTGIRWDEHYPAPVSTPASEPTPPPAPPQVLEMRSRQEFVVIARWLPRVFWALLAIVVAVVLFV